MRTLLRSWLLSLIPLALLMAYLRWRNPGFFFIDDKQAQYSATFHYIGDELLAGRLPILVPGQGTAANLLLDAQYGLMNPIYWAQNIAYAQFDDLLLATWLMAGLYLTILAGGATAWALRLGATAGWAGIAGGAASLSGFTLYFLAASWHPGLASLAFLPWFGWALSAPRQRVPDVLAIVVTAFAVFGGGWPFTAVAAALLLASNLVEFALRRQYRAAVARLVATSSGALLAAPTLLFLAAALDWTVRAQSLANNNFLVPNFIDVLNTSMATAASNMNSFRTDVMPAPLMLAGGIGLSLAALVDWRGIQWRAPGVVTLALGAGAILLMTQAPDQIGPLRWPFRMLGPWQVILPVALAVAASTLGLKVTRQRVAAAGVILGVGFFLALARTPDSGRVQAVSLALAAALLLLLVQRRHVAAAMAVGAIGIWAVHTFPVQPLPNWGMPDQVRQYQPLGSGQMLVLYPRGDTRAYVRQGVYLGQNYLYTEHRSGNGYSPVSQRFLNDSMCGSSWGFVCPEVPEFLTSVEARTGKQWAALLGPDVIVAEKTIAAGLSAGLDADWRAASEENTTDFRVFRTKAAESPGRITFVSGGASAVEALASSATSQSYRFPAASDGQDRLVVFSDVYWPGYRATWEGEALEVFPLEDSLVAVEVPPTAGELRVTYVPAGTSAAVISVVAGLLLLIASTMLARRRGGADEQHSGRTIAAGDRLLS